MSSSAPAAPGSPAGRKMTKPVSTNAPKRKKKGLRELQMPGARNLFHDGDLGIVQPGDHVDEQTHAGGRRRRRRKSKRKSHKKSHKKKRRTKRRRKSRKKKSKRRRR